MSLSQLTRYSVLQAIQEFDSIGRDAFLTKYGFKPARSYLVLHNGQCYDSKAICGAAHRHVAPSSKPLQSSDFSGGHKTVATVLQRLGFVVVRSAPRLFVADESGNSLRATCDLLREGDRWVIVLHSAGGTKGSTSERNPDYKKALDCLVRRLEASGLKVEDVLLDTDRTGGLSQAERRLVQKRPMIIGVDMSSADFVKAMTKAMTRKGSKATSGGNPRRQIRIEVAASPDSSRSGVIEALIQGTKITRPLFVLTWSPKKWEMSDTFHREAASKTQRGEIFSASWSTGNRRQGIQPGDEVVLLRQQSERGLIAYGVATSEVKQGQHWNGSDKDANYIDVDWREWLLVDERLKIEELAGATKSTDWDNIMASGIRLSDVDANVVRSLWDRPGAPKIDARTGDEAVAGLVEGAKTTVLVNRYERNRRAREECINHHGGPICLICGIDFRVQYGGIAPNFIHVHHLVPIASIGSAYELEPKTDLIPVCPNCHAMIHHGVDTPRTPDEVRALLQREQRR